MKPSERTLRIFGASSIAILSIGTAYVLSGPTPFDGLIGRVEAQSTEEILAAYAAKDTDRDGLPDWQEALYGTDPAKTDTDGDGISDAVAVAQGLVQPNALASQLPDDPSVDGGVDVDEIPGVDPAPGSITERFSRVFMERYAAASRGAPMDEAAQQALVQQLLQEFSRDASAALVSRYALVSIRTSSAVSLTDYAGQVEQIMRDNDIAGPDGDPLPLMQALVVNEDASARRKLAAVGSAYRSMADQLLAVSVPPILADEHLTLVRSLDELAKSTSIVVAYEEDPLGTLGAIGAFQNASAALAGSISAVATEIVRTGEPDSGMPGELLVGIARQQTQ